MSTHNRPGAAEGRVVAGTVCWPPEGAGDFADVAWVIAAALGNGSGLRAVDLARRGERVAAHLYSTGPGYVRAVAASFGWELYDPDDGYATTWGRLGGVDLYVTWLTPADAHSTTKAVAG